MTSGRWAGSTRRARLPNDWPKRRAAVLKRDNGVCHVCRGPGADAVDHIIPGDDHSLENLAPIHDRVWPHCHRRKSAAEGSRAAQAKRIPRRRPEEPHPGLI